MTFKVKTSPFYFSIFFREAAKKRGGIKAIIPPPPNVPTFQRPSSSREGGGLGLNGPAIKRRTFFFGFPYLSRKAGLVAIIQNVPAQYLENILQEITPININR